MLVIHTYLDPVNDKLINLWDSNRSNSDLLEEWCLDVFLKMDFNMLNSNIQHVSADPPASDRGYRKGVMDMCLLI